MLRRFRHAVRNRVVRAIDDGTRPHFAASAADALALREEIGRLQDQLRAVDSELKGQLSAWERRNRRDIFTAADWHATATSADFLRRELGRAVAHFHKHDTLRAALAQAPAEGLYLEFGVATGSTLQIISERAAAGSLYGFDSFQGLPEHWRNGYAPGEFAMAELPDVPGAELVVGLFEDTLPGFLARTPGSVAFLHLDADLYSSTWTALRALAPRMQAGTVVVFDEYFNFPGWEEHEHRAWSEFCTQYRVQFDYLGFTADDEQVAMRLRNAPVPPQQTSSESARRERHGGSAPRALAASRQPVPQDA